MLLPKKFQLVDREWSVNFVTRKEFLEVDPSAADACGSTVEEMDLVVLCLEEHTNEESLARTFWHEFGHCLTFAEGHREHDEVAVERLGCFLAQSMRNWEPAGEVWDVRFAADGTATYKARKLKARAVQGQ